MARKIQNKYGPKARLPKLPISEIASTTDTKEIFIGGEEANIQIAKKDDVDAVSKALVAKADQSAVTALTGQLADKATKADLIPLVNKAEKSEVTTVATQVSTLESKVNSQASGSPKGVYATLATLQAAFPGGNSNTYVVTADGKWYYWNGTVWTPGSQYQSTGILEKSITKKEIADNGVFPTNLSNAVVGINLLDLTDIIPNFYVDVTTGNLVGGGSYSVSNYIPIKPGTSYGVFGNSRVAFYDSNKVFISGVQARTFTSPANTAFIRVSLVNATLSSHFLLEGNTNTPNHTVPYQVKLPWLRIEKDNISSLPKITLNDIEGVIVSSNLYSKITSKDGFYLDVIAPNLGKETTNAAYTISEYISASENNSYTAVNIRHYVCFDKNKLALSSAQIDTANHTFTTPTGTAYIRVSILMTNKATAMLVKGSSVPNSYIEHGGDITWFKPAKSKYAEKVAVNFGDSITASIENQSLNNYGAYITQDTGIIAINQGYSSGRMGYNSGGGRNPFSMYKLADAIVTGVFTEQDNALATLDSSNIAEYTAQLAKLKAINFNNVDFITLAFGTNDWYGSISPIDNASDPYDVNNYYGATRYVIKTLQVKFPHLKFLLMTPIFRFDVPDTATGVITQYSDTWKINGYTLPDMVNALKVIGKELNVPIVDMYHELGINKHNCKYWFASLSSGVYDGTHPNIRTKELMGRKVASAILSKY